MRGWAWLRLPCRFAATCAGEREGHATRAKAQAIRINNTDSHKTEYVAPTARRGSNKGAGAGAGAVVEAERGKGGAQKK